MCDNEILYTHKRGKPFLILYNTHLVFIRLFKYKKINSFQSYIMGEEKRLYNINSCSDI